MNPMSSDSSHSMYSNVLRRGINFSSRDLSRDKSYREIRKSLNLPYNNQREDCNMTPQ